MLKYVLMFGLSCCLSFAGGKAFHNLSLDEALKRAETEGKYVFVDFYTTWCGPCKMMDRTTFQDQKVIDWLGTHTIALAIDAEAQADIASRYKINSYPSLVFLKADGKLALKLTGYHPTERFLEQAARVLDGKPLDQAAREALAADPENPALKYALAKTLVELDQKDEAFELGKKILADVRAGKGGGVDHNGLYYMLSRTGGPAGAELLKGEYQRIHDKMMRGEIEPDDLADYPFLSSMTRGETVLQLFDALKAAGTPAEKLTLFNHVTFRPLMAEHRYAEIDSLLSVEKRVAEMDEHVAKSKDIPHLKEIKRAVMLEKTRMYQVLRGMSADQRATQLAEAILAESQDADAYNGLAWGDYEVKRMDQRTLEWAKRANDLSGGTNPEILDTYARVLAGMGQPNQAVEVLKAALPKMPEGRERDIIQTCLDEITKS